MEVETTKEGFVGLSEGRVRYSIAGQPQGSEGATKAVVCVHGIDGSVEWWTWLAAHLSAEETTATASTKWRCSKGFCVLSFDLYGRGQSSAPAKLHTPELFNQQIDELVTALNFPQPFALVGHSLGGGIAVAYAAAHPEKVESLVLIGPVGLPCAIPFGAELDLESEDMTAQDFKDPSACQDVIQVLQKAAAQLDMNAFAEAFANSFNNFPLLTMKQVVEAVGGDTWRTKRKKTGKKEGDEEEGEKQSLLIWGEEDEIVSFKACFGAYVQSLRPSHTLVVTRCKHSPHLERHGGGQRQDSCIPQRRSRATGGSHLNCFS
ncbi:putative 2-succinyl-6-hydroxy-2,4-cyclohexadiene-1-carboxylate synthase [Balamuthia mandrillaris]